MWSEARGKRGKFSHEEAQEGEGDLATKALRARGGQRALRDEGDITEGAETRRRGENEAGGNGRGSGYPRIPPDTPGYPRIPPEYDTPPKHRGRCISGLWESNARVSWAEKLTTKRHNKNTKKGGGRRVAATAKRGEGVLCCWGRGLMNQVIVIRIAFLTLYLLCLFVANSD